MGVHPLCNPCADLCASLKNEVEAIQRNVKERPLSTFLIHNCPFCFHFLEAVLPTWCFHQAPDFCSTYETCLCVVHNVWSTCACTCMCMDLLRSEKEDIDSLPISIPPQPPTLTPIPLRRVLSLNLESVVFQLTW